MKYLTLTLICTLTAAMLLCATASAQTITLTPAQVADVCGPVAPPVEPEPPQPEPPVPDPEDPQIPEQCQSVPGGTLRDWQNVFVYKFPLPQYLTKTNMQYSGDYLALKFRTGNVVDHGKISAPNHASTPRIREGAISQCVGDFNVSKECSHTWGEAGGITWSLDGTRGCKLKPNTTYYLNFRFKGGCDLSRCYFNLRHVNL